MSAVVHCKKSPFDVYIGRPSKWGNPYSHKEDTTAQFKVNTREEAIIAYEKYLLNTPELMNSLVELKDKVLGCWCYPKACHGEILTQYANQVGNYNLIVAGSRSWNDYELMKSEIRCFFKHYHLTKTNNPLTIISGTARGADQLGASIARTHHLELIEMPADWNKHGRSAGYKRNEEMAKVAKGCIVFWDGQSKGSQHMWNLAKTYKLQRALVQIDLPTIYS